MGITSRRLRPAAAILAAAAVAVSVVSSVSAEVAQKDGVRVAVTGKMSPTKLPRSGTAPVAVSVAGHIVPTKPGALPKLEQIQLAINSHGKLQTNAFPLCRLGHIDPSTTSEALLACGGSLVGEGHFSANVKIPEQSPFPSEGKVLAFNGKLNGRPAIFAHIYGTTPVPTSYVLPFLIERSKGTYGNLLKASLPEATGEWGYVTGVALNLDKSFLAAACPAPKGFPGTTFPLLRTSFGFEGGPTLTSTLNRSCRVK
jgi:hypothetical protein